MLAKDDSRQEPAVEELCKLVALTVGTQASPGDQDFHVHYRKGPHLVFFWLRKVLCLVFFKAHL